MAKNDEGKLKISSRSSETIVDSSKRVYTSSEKKNMFTFAIGLLFIVALYQFLSHAADPNYVIGLNFDSLLNCFRSENILSIDMNWINNINIDSSGISIKFLKDIVDKFNGVWVGIMTLLTGFANSLLFIVSLIKNLIFM